MEEFIFFAKSIGLYVGSPMKTEPRFSHPTTQAAWLTWKHLKDEKTRHL